MASFDNIRLEKGLYTLGKSFTEALESIDPSENYVGTSLEGLDAYQRQLKRFDIKVGGRNSDSIEKFFRTTDSAALFPEYISRAVWQGYEENDLLSKIIATTTVIDGLDYRSLAVDIAEIENTITAVNEGTFIPETKVSVKDNLVELKKYGRMLTASYESIKFQRLDLFTIALKQIGASIARTQFTDAVNTILGDDGSGRGADYVEVGSLEDFKYEDLVSLWTAFNKFKLTTIIAPSNLISIILKMNEFRDSAAGLSFHATGNIVTPFGAELIHMPSLVSDTLIGLDKSSTLERVQAGPLTTEFDKLIDRQLERASVTLTSGFAKIYNEAAKIVCEA